LEGDVLRRVVAELAKWYGVSEDRVRLTTALRHFAGGDSLDLVGLVIALDDELSGGPPPAAFA
jgi:acyl carrier protein